MLSLPAPRAPAQWERFLGDLVRRGLTSERLEMLCVDGGSGLGAALPTAYPEVPVQRCWVGLLKKSVVAEPVRAIRRWPTGSRSRDGGRDGAMAGLFLRPEPCR